MCIYIYVYIRVCFFIVFYKRTSMFSLSLYALSVFVLEARYQPYYGFKKHKSILDTMHIANNVNIFHQTSTAWLS